MKIFGLLANAILTMVGKSSFDTPLTWSFVTCITGISHKRRHTGGQALDSMMGGARRPARGIAILETYPARCVVVDIMAYRKSDELFGKQNKLSEPSSS